jgi:hypothetical protein
VSSSSAFHPGTYIGEDTVQDKMRLVSRGQAKKVNRGEEEEKENYQEVEKDGHKD